MLARRVALGHRIAQLRHAADLSQEELGNRAGVDRCTIPAVLDDLLLIAADDAVLVQGTSIIVGMRMLLDHAGLVEPSAAPDLIPK